MVGWNDRERCDEKWWMGVKTRYIDLGGLDGWELMCCHTDRSCYGR